MKYKFGMALVCGASLLGMSGCSDVSEKPSNADVAKAWIEAGQIGQEATIGAVEQYMAEDGLFYRPRYVGFGFTYDNTDESGRMIVETIVPDSPAASVLELGDEFTAVRGVAVNAENRDSGALSFRGAPGEEVSAVITRGVKNLSILQ